MFLPNKSSAILDKIKKYLTYSSSSDELHRKLLSNQTLESEDEEVEQYSFCLCTSGTALLIINDQKWPNMEYIVHTYMCSQHK